MEMLLLGLGLILQMKLFKTLGFCRSTRPTCRSAQLHEQSSGFGKGLGRPELQSMGQGSKFRGSTQPSSALADGADWCWYLSLIFELRFVIPSEHLSSTATLLNLICTLGDMFVSSTAPTKSRPGAGHTHLAELVASPRVLPDR